MTTYNILCACQLQNRVTIVGTCIPNRVQETSRTIHIFGEWLFLVCIKICSSHRQTVFPIPFGKKKKQTNTTVFRLNFAVLTLIPKIEDASEMKAFQPISLLNCSFKIFSKVLTLRLERVSQRRAVKEQSVTSYP
jgi:hypothetical protein